MPRATIIHTCEAKRGEICACNLRSKIEMLACDIRRKENYQRVRESGPEMSLFDHVELQYISEFTKLGLSAVVLLLSHKLIISERGRKNLTPSSIPALLSKEEQCSDLRESLHVHRGLNPYCCKVSGRHCGSPSRASDSGDSYISEPLFSVAFTHTLTTTTATLDSSQHSINVWSTAPFLMCQDVYSKLLLSPLYQIDIG